MKFFAKIVITGFGLALGGAVFKKVSPYLGLDDKAKKPATDDLATAEGAIDPGLRQQPQN